MNSSSEAREVCPRALSCSPAQWLHSFRQAVHKNVRVDGQQSSEAWRGTGVTWNPRNLCESLSLLSRGAWYAARKVAMNDE
ncbi:hypothetical protein BST61_g7399 [Cercospora zeina]